MTSKGPHGSSARTWGAVRAHAVDEDRRSSRAPRGSNVVRSRRWSNRLSRRGSARRSVAPALLEQGEKSRRRVDRQVPCKREQVLVTGNQRSALLGGERQQV